MDNNILIKNPKLFHRDFTLMVIGQIISLLGNIMLGFALSLYVLDKTGSAAVFGSILAISTLPIIFISPIGGVIADRINRKNIMVALDFSTAAIIVILALFINHGGIIFIIGAAKVLFSIIYCVYMPAVQSSIPLLTSDENLLKANSIIVQVNAIASLAGPILGGLLYGIIGIMPILIISAICFTASAIMEIFIRIPFIKQKAHDSVLKILKHDLGQATVLLTSEGKILIKVLLVMSLANFSMASYMTVGLPYITKAFLGLTDIHYGFLQSSMGVGAILGGLLIGIVGKRIKNTQVYRLLLAGSMFLLPISIATFSNARPNLSYAVILCSTLLMMLMMSMSNIICQTVLQQLTPDTLLGKVSAIVMAISTCATPLGQAMYGFLFDAVDNDLMFIGLATLAAGIGISFAARHMLKWFKNNTTEDFKRRVMIKLGMS